MQVIQDPPGGFFQVNREALERSMRLAVRDALLDHKRNGNPIATWRDGKVVIIPAHEIPVDDPLVHNHPQHVSNGNDAKNGET